MRIISLENLNLKVVAGLCKLFESIKITKLSYKMVSSILFNFQLWIYLPIETQLFIYRSFFQLVEKYINSFETRSSYFNISKIIRSISLYLCDKNENMSICLANDPKINIKENKMEAKIPSDCDQIRLIFWEVIKKMTKKMLSKDDIPLIISYCFNISNKAFIVEVVTYVIF